MAQLKLSDTVINESVDRVVSGFEKLESDMLTRIYSELRKISTSNGAFVFDDSSAKLLSTIKKIVGEVFTNKHLDKSIDELIDGFQEAEKITISQHQTANGLIVPKKLINDTRKIAIDEVIFNLKDAQMNSRFVEPVRKLLNKQIQLGGTFTDTEKALAELMTGGADKKGLLSRWVGQVSRDAMSQYQGAIHQKIASEYKMNGYNYIGSLVNDSRQHCVNWVGMSWLPIEELPALIESARGKSGFIDTTTVDTFAVNRGGYRCRHEAIPSKEPI